MYNHFVDDTSYSGGLIVNPKFNYVSQLYRSELDRIKAFLNTTAMTVNNQHLLVRILGTIDTLYSTDIKNYMLSIYNEVEGIERMYGIASGTNGRVSSYRGMFYSKECNDTLLSVIEYFDFYNENPERIVPLRAYSHPFTALTAGAPDGRYRSTANYNDDLSVSLIDIPKLAFVYWHWVNRNKQAVTDRFQALGNFVYRHILSRMVPSVLEVSYFNRICAKQYGERIDDWVAYYPIALNDHSVRVDEMIDYYLEMIKDSTVIFDKVLTTIPALLQTNMGGVFKLPDININRNNAWLILVSRIDIYLLVLSLAYNQRSNSNINEVKNKLRFIINAIITDNALNIKVPYVTMTKINRIRFMLG